MKYLTLIKQGKTQHKVWELMEAQISTVLMDTGLAWLADVALQLDTDEQFKAHHEQWLGQTMCTINCNGVLALWDTFIVDGDTSAMQEVFLHIFKSRQMLHVAQGMVFNHTWVFKLELNPLVQALVALKLHFKNLNKVLNVNLATELGVVLQLQQNVSLH
eukprot:3801040-Rhodomonas_salina.1